MNIDNLVLEFLKQNPESSSDEIRQGISEKKKYCHDKKTFVKTSGEETNSLNRKRKSNKIYIITTL